MAARLVRVDRQTPMLLPVDMRDWVPDEDLVHFVIGAVEGMRLPGLRLNERGTGDAQYPPSMMLALLIYCYARGVFGSRRIEAATYRDLGVRYLTGDTHPDHDTICKFRRENFEVVAQCFVGVLELAREMRLLAVGTISIDGTKMAANASKHKSLTHGRAVELAGRLRRDVEELLKQAEAADAAGEGKEERLPEQIARREALLEKMGRAQAELERRARERAGAERADYEAKLAARAQRQGGAKGKNIKPPVAGPGQGEQVNLSDPDSRLMRPNKSEGYRQAYNAQLGVDADGSQMILGARVSQSASDANELVAGVDAVPAALGPVGAVLADKGYANGEQVGALQSRGIGVYVSVGAEADSTGRRYDFRPPVRRGQKIAAPKLPWMVAMKARLQSDAARRLYARRKQTVEPVFGIIRAAMGFNRFLLRGKAKVQGEWQLVALAYNFGRLHRLSIARMAQGARN